MMGVNVNKLVLACTSKNPCPFIEDRFKCPQTIECEKVKEHHWTKHIIKSDKIRKVLISRFPE